MSVIISVFYPLWYRSYRMSIKEILETDTATAAKTLLDTVVTEHDDNNDTLTDIDENIILHHTQNHLNAVVRKNDPIFIIDDQGNIQHQSDIVKQVLDE